MKRLPWWRRQRRVWVLVVNCASVSTRRRNAVAVVRRATRTRRGRRTPDIILLSECGDFLLRNIVDTAVWQVIQFGDLGSPESGCAILLRRDRVHHESDGHELMSAEGEGIRDRSAVLADDVTARFGADWVHVLDMLASTHSPPKYAPGRQDVHLRNVRTLIDPHGDVATLVGGDFNQRKRQLRAWFPWAQVRAIEVLGVVAEGVDLGRARRRRVGSDHPGVLVPILLGRAL